MKRRAYTRTSIAVAALCSVGLVVAGSPAVAAVPVDTRPLTNAVTFEGLDEHLAALQQIATDNGGNRAAGTPGYAASVDYVEGVMKAAGYNTVRQPFSYSYGTYEGSAFEQVSPNPAVYAIVTDYFPMDYTGEGDVTAQVQAVDINLSGDRASTSGCEAADFAGFVAGRIALIQRGSCNFSVKADNAVAAGASAVIIFNQGNTDPADDRFGVFGGTLDPPVRTVPVVSTSFDRGAEFAGTAGLVLRLKVDIDEITIETENLIASSKTGRTDRKVLVGAHLDSVPEGPGINDNGSGTAALLEIAQQMTALGIQPRNQVVFAFWGGEEDGLNGSNYYVSQLSKTQIKQHAVNLNFDMLGSPNGGRFIYDGDGGAFGSTGPNGSDIVEDVFEGWFAERQLYTEPTAFDGRSDYFAFINAGIPAGGLFSGAEDLKSAAQAQPSQFGGTAGIAFDPCYHAVCDDIDNIDADLYEEMADAAAHAVYTFAATTSAVNGTAKGKAVGQVDWAYKGQLALR